jgi:ketosteroid isomerase-like protein
MPARTPEELDPLFAEALNAGNVEGVVALYEPQACLVLEPGKVAKGTAALRDEIAGLVAMKPKMTIETSKVAEAEGVAFLSGKWTIDGTGPDGKPTRMEGRSVEVCRRQPSGEWRFAIDSPFGLGQTRA